METGTFGTLTSVVVIKYSTPHVPFVWFTPLVFDINSAGKVIYFKQTKQPFTTTFTQP
jgi:hypothetical protein